MLLLLLMLGEICVSLLLLLLLLLMEELVFITGIVEVCGNVTGGGSGGQTVVETTDPTGDGVGDIIMLLLEFDAICCFSLEPLRNMASFLRASINEAVVSVTSIAALAPETIGGGAGGFDLRLNSATGIGN